ncbi:FtsW/RodA/SpoVE family cell cycle protein [Paenibacillus sp. MER 180]|uniref:FtsW/RodA/SpoVE family cell cycle protein n=1 Tax=unclassified Paenibacillus TaxID=185978 RepID=UPI0008064DA6|nr:MULTISPECIES: FtsW/RodA/SpoVE family cell cycle protein [unclassified Paenibacillus]MCM3291327.1 FtsW/RodA/SpoVE family cell cycle protein [Paenibacillus sp. MER 180]OBY77270.1 hypothetical protein BBG47_22620 [Paenibacillus sp. KS1]
MTRSEEGRDTKHSSNLEQFVGDVLAHVKAKQMHGEIRAELLDHLLNEIEYGMDHGMDESAAAQQAVRNMGGPSVMAAQFNQVHRPKAPWKLWISVFVWIAICVVGLFAVQAGNPQDLYRLSAEGYAWRLVPGVVAFLFAFWVGYQKLQKGAVWLYSLTLLLSILTIYSSLSINGQSFLSIGTISINMLYISPFLVLIALYSITSNKFVKMHRTTLLLALLSPPIIIYLADGRLLQLCTFLCGVLVVGKLAGWKWGHFKWAACGIVIAGGLCYGFIERLRLLVNIRIENWLHTLNGSADISYLHNITQQILRGAGWFGHGIGELASLPYVTSDNLSIAIIHMFGWVGGLIMLIALTIIITTMFRQALLFRDPYAKGLGILISSMMAVHCLLYIGGIIGIIPINGAGFPMLGSGGSEIVLWMMLLGLYSSAHWNKDMIPVMNR